MFRALLMVFGLIVLTGCSAPNKLAFVEDPAEVINRPDPVILMTTHFRNDYKTAYQPEMISLRLKSLDEAGKEQLTFYHVGNDKSALVEFDDKKKGFQYLISVQVPPNDYAVYDMFMMGRSFPFWGTYGLALDLPFSLEKGGLYYLGHVEAVIREKVEGEFKAGPIIPLIDQAIIGAAGGTFDVTISDRFDEDMKMFYQRFPAIQGKTIEKKILPAFDRTRWDD
jgi:hypothetical protein